MKKAITHISKTIFYRVILIFLLLPGFKTGSAIIMQPYLMGVQQNSIWVLVECSTPDTVTVEFGTSPSYGSTRKTFSISTTTNATYVHKIYVNSLAENTVYYYRARQLGVPSAGFSFITACSEQTPFRFVAIGDFRTGVDIHDRITSIVPSYNPRFYLNNGDVAVTGDYSDFKNEFFRQGELNLISSVPFFLATGNHENWSTNTKAFTKGITVSSGTEDYYSFDYGNMHVLVLNTMADYSAGSPQYNFAMADLGSTTKRWKVVTSHYPAYCSGGHGEDSGMIILSQNIFVPKGVDMVISGHSHFYQHNVVSGIHHMVLGGGGAPLYDPSDAPYTVKSVKDYNFGIADVAANTFTLRVYNSSNILLDTVQLVKNPAAIHEHGSVIKGFSIRDVYPNPSNPAFTVSFDISADDKYTLRLIDIRGRIAGVIKQSRLAPGHYEETVSTKSLSSGVYFVMLSSYSNFESVKISVVK